MRILVALIIYFLSTSFLNAQGFRIKEIQVSVFNNATALPFSGSLGIFHGTIHPGVSAGASMQLNQHERHQLMLSLKFAYLYQQYVQHGLQLYPELGYRYVFSNGISIGPQLGLGYLHAITDLQQFELNDKGEYYRMYRTMKNSQ